MALEGVVNLCAALDMAGSSDADANRMSPGRTMPEVVVERRNAGNRCRGNLCYLTDPLKSFLGQIVVVTLDNLQYLENVFGAGADLRNGAIYKCQIQLFHQSPFPMQYRFSAPRI